ncbi:divergent polysaccharide deacetylase family protein [Maridesulfovibrio zosterae]|uniref:divergent polysaccharide deacetylase family protein n=1 Tax=Maridesulfovibrio zosterae TaxID=82171 RepID=UPI00042143AE|nr:divergent polysaccharide deacetylase family protein [Maridesulfovibrio zosterae]
MKNSTSENNDKPEIPAGKPGLRAYLFKPAGIAAITVAAAASVCLVIALVVSSYSGPTTESSGNSQEQQNLTADQRAAQNQHPLYEEPMEDNLDDLVKQVDLTLINTLKNSKIAMRDLRLEDVSLKKHQGHDFHFQQLRFPYKGDKNKFISKIKNEFDAKALNASIHEVASDCWLISINGVPTHKFFIFAPIVKPKQTPRKAGPHTPKMAIVIDDMGEDVALAKGLAALDAHVTFSIWPNSSHVKKTLAIARKNGNEIMIHLPMQPKGYPKINPGSDALLVGMSADKIHKTVLAAIKKVPGAKGLNNHMGSLFTENYAGMREVMSPLHQKKLFFLDSRTTPKSAGPKAARKAGVTTYERNIFLDNVKDISAIKYQLSKTAKIAKKKGQAIAIGHPNWETLKAIKQWAKENQGEINIVPVGSLIPKGQ